MSSRRFKPQLTKQGPDDRAILVGVDLGSRSWPIEESLAELARLAETAGAEVVGTVSQRMDAPNPRTFIGSGKAEDVATMVRQTEATHVVFDDDLTPSQQANLEDTLAGPRVLDRTALILEIFAQHATSREGKLQVELAEMEYALPRLKGLWGHLVAERLGGGRGARFGAGESQLETDRRLTRKRISELKRELRKVDGDRVVQRHARAQSGVFRASLVGYTNAGKSTLENALTDAGVLEADKLFATLDATTRQLELPRGRMATLTDTVGFIHKLPHGLVEAFKSTLDETRDADLLVHVIDASDPDHEAQITAVDEVLGELGVAAKPQVRVYNKVDLLPADEVERLARRNPSGVFISAATGVGLDILLERISSEAARGSVSMELLVPHTRGDVVRTAHELADVTFQESEEDGYRLNIRAPRTLVARFAEFETTVRAPEAKRGHKTRKGPG
jgi:GTP-binding protein HflX